MESVVFGQFHETSLVPNNLLLTLFITNMSLRKLLSDSASHGKDGKQAGVYSAIKMPGFPSGYAAPAARRVGDNRFLVTFSRKYCNAIVFVSLWKLHIACFSGNA
jgi:hypothetical protein